MMGRNLGFSGAHTVAKLFAVTAVSSTSTNSYLRLFSSNTGTAWTARSPVPNSSYVYGKGNICEDNGTFLIVGYTYGLVGFSYVYTPYAATSTDAITWTQRTPAPSSNALLFSSCAGNGLFVAAGMTSTGTPIACKSTNGVSWSSVSLPSAATTADFTAAWGKYLNGKYIFVGPTTAPYPDVGILYSDDGTTWYFYILGLNQSNSRGHGPITGGYISPAVDSVWIDFDGTNYVLVATMNNRANTTIVYSDANDFNTWTYATGYAPTGTLFYMYPATPFGAACALTNGENKFYAVGENGGGLKSFDHGVTWSPVASFGGNSGREAIFAYGNFWVCDQNSQRVYYSDNLTSWSYAATTGAYPQNIVAR